MNREYVNKLQQRIKNLEELNQNNQGNQRTANGSARRPSENGTRHPVDPSVTPEDLSASTAPSTDTISKEPPRSNNTNTSESVTLNMSSSHQQMVTASMSTVVNDKAPENSNSNTTTTGGSPTFYGVTSHPHVVSPSEDSRLTSCDEPETVDIGLDPLSPHLQDDLLHSFFKYQKLWVDIVNKESFLTNKAYGYPSRWYSKFLENAILASATRLSTSKAVRALGTKYLEWAKDDAMSAMSEPTPAGLQGFLLLSEYEVTQGNDRPGWMYCVACRMLSDLGLHKLAGNVGKPVESTESTRESDLAYGLMSACVVYEGVWTLYLGRPSSIPRSVMRAAVSRCKARRKSDSPWLNAWVGLCEPMAEISHVLNDQSNGDVDKSASLRKLLKQVEGWYEDLPLELMYNESRLINMDMAGYGLHTQYCKVQILLRRALAKPLNTKKRQYYQTTSDCGSQASSDDLDAVIYQHALRIARLLVTYREAFGVEKIPSIMLDNAVVAATAMIAHLNNSGILDRMQKELLWLRQLIKSIETLQPHFPIVRRMLDALKQICGSGPLCSLLPSSGNRGSTSTLSHKQAMTSQFQDFSSRSNDVREDPGAMGSGRDMTWDMFDMETDSAIVFAGAFDNFVFDLPLAEALIPDSSNLAQVAGGHQDVSI
ncbi:hypothetical protein ACEPPN_009282 [Leptodophora sp. 'Broadleaf-Isolate-01']